MFPVHLVHEGYTGLEEIPVASFRLPWRQPPPGPTLRLVPVRESSRPRTGRRPRLIERVDVAAQADADHVWSILLRLMGRE